MSRLVVELTPEEHKELKIRALTNNQTVKEYTKAYLFRLPNEETLEALNDIESNSNLTEFSSVDDLLTA